MKLVALSNAFYAAKNKMLYFDSALLFINTHCAHPAYFHLPRTIRTLFIKAGY